jgi:hypothetical protein
MVLNFKLSVKSLIKFSPDSLTSADIISFSQAQRNDLSDLSGAKNHEKR